MDDGWFKLTLHTSGQVLFVRADTIQAVYTAVNAGEVAYTAVDTGRDQWYVKESADYIMSQFKIGRMLS